MLNRYIIWWHRCKRYIVLLFLVILVYCDVNLLHAMEYTLPSDVKVVKNEKAMINNMIQGMRKHESQFVFYYPGIYEDFKRYEEESNAYATFFEKLAKKDGYVTGIVSGYCITMCGNEMQCVTIQFCYLTTKSQERRINKQVKKIVKRIGKGNRARKAKQAHDYLVQHMTYDSKYYNPYHAFSKGKGICMSYALAYQRLLQEMKIPCIYVKGKNHAWNMVKIEGYWYNVDVTWDDNRNRRYRYFLKADVDFPGHKRPPSKWFKSLKKAKRSYNMSRICK